MNGDLSRVTFDQLKHYSRVVMQQGRVQVDADWNEQTAILLHYLQTLAQDLIGPHGGPADLLNQRNEIVSKNFGFEIKLNAAGDNFEIGAGRYYVDGRLCEKAASELYSRQPDLPLLDEKNLPLEEGSRFAGLPLNQPLLVYLDVWERHITFIEDPAIREVALGGADTAARTKLLCQVKIESKNDRGQPVPAGTTCESIRNIWPGFLNRWQPAIRGMLRAKAREGDKAADSSEPCITSPDARYRRLENQHYRVEIHEGGPAANATFKWSRDNGSIVAPVLKKQGNDLIVGGFRDITRWFAASQWIELAYDAIELQGKPRTMIRLANVDGETLTIDPAAVNGVIFDPGETVSDPATGISHPKFKNLKVRAWDHKEIGETALRNGAVKIAEVETEEGDWMDLEDGVQIQFLKAKQAPDHVYRTGDYWLIPARVADGDVEWTVEKMLDSTTNPPKMTGRAIALPPHGVEHHYAPLAIIQLSGENRLVASVDLRHKFPASGRCADAA
jgi:hypothetical protein